MNRLSLKHLRYFRALAQQSHFGRAAELCSVSQPALSVKIRELEKILGVLLVERDTRRARLTPAGLELAARVQEVLNSVDELAGYARMSQGLLGGTLRIGAIPTVAPYLLPRAIKNLTRHDPGLEVVPREAVTQKLTADLLEARLDVALMALPTSEPGLAAEPLLKEEFVLVRPFEDAEKPVPDARALRAMELWLLEEGHCFREQALSFCGSPAPRRLMQGSSLSTLVQMVGVGIGVTLIPRMAVSLETRSANVSVARLSPPRPTRLVGLVWRKTNPLADRFAELAARIL